MIIFTFEKEALQNINVLKLKLEGKQNEKNHIISDLHTFNHYIFT